MNHKTPVQLFDQGMLFLTFFLVLHKVLASGAIHGDGVAQDQIILLHGADKESRGYSRSCALRYESPIVQSKIYRESRSRTLSKRFLGRKALVIFDAERLPLAKSALREGKIFSVIGNFDPPTSRLYYVSWYLKYCVPGEGTELVYLLHEPSQPDASCLAWKFSKYSVPPDSFEFPCLYPPSGAFHLANADRILRFDANGRRIGDPDWPIRMTVMAIVFEAIQIAGENLDACCHKLKVLKAVSLVASLTMARKSFPTTLTSVNSISLMIPSHSYTHVPLDQDSSATLFQ